MNELYPPILVNATPDDFLAVLRDMHRHDPIARADLDLSHGATIAQWCAAYGLRPWQKFAQSLNARLRVAIPMEQWHEVLVPARKRRVRDVCELLARHAKLPRIRPVNFLGSDCLTAGAFLTIRSYLADEGADVHEVAPSTPLHEYTRRYSQVFLGPISQLAPAVRVRAPIFSGLLIGIVLAWIAMMISFCFGLYAICAFAGLGFGLCYVGVCTIGRSALPTSVKFPGLKTFRDISKVIAAGAR